MKFGVAFRVCWVGVWSMVNWIVMVNVLLLMRMRICCLMLDVMLEPRRMKADSPNTEQVTAQA